MANENLLSAAMVPISSVEALNPALRTIATIKPPIPVPTLPAPTPTPAPVPVAPAPAATPPPPAPVVPAPPAGSPFASLPFPSPGDRIKADDFKALSQSLNIVYNMVVLSASLVGYTLADAKAALTGQRYVIQRVISVFGNELPNPGDTAFDTRKVLQVIPAAPGDARLAIIVTESVDTRRFAPNLVGLTYQDAASRIQTLLADVTITGAPPAAPQLTGLTLTQAENSFT